jgi:alpha-glucoside transport system permease protein
VAWLSGPIAQAVGLALLAAMVVPVQVIAGPVNEVLGVVRLGGSASGLALVHLAFGLPFAVLLLRNALADVSAPPGAPGPADRPARVGRGVADGPAHPARRRRGSRPGVRPGVDLALGLLFSGPDGTPFGPLFYAQTRQFVSNSGQLAAGSTLVSLLPVLLVILARRQIIAGLVSGALR